MTELIEQFSNWLVETPLSHLIADRVWAIAYAQSIHYIALGGVVLAAVLLNLRVMGIAGRNQSLALIAAHHVPWIWASLVVLLITGLILNIAEPARQLASSTFQIKVVMILIVVGITHYYAKTLRKDANYWDPDRGHRRLGMVLGSLSLFLWVGIIVAGRLVAYV